MKMLHMSALKLFFPLIVSFCVVLCKTEQDTERPPMLTASLDGLMFREGGTWKPRELNSTSYTVSVDYHWDRGYIYWTSMFNPSGNVIRATIDDDGNLTSVMTVARRNSKYLNIKYIAVDWIHDNLYYIDYLRETADHQFYVTNLDGSAAKVIHTTGQSPMKMVLDPFKKYIYYPTTRALIRLNMDGSEEKELASINRAWDIFIVVDFEEDRLYYYNPSTQTIDTMTSEGTDRRVITHLPYVIKHIALYKDDIYFLGKWKNTRSMYNLERYNKIDKTIYEMDNDTRILDFAIFDQSAQKQGTNVCAGLSHGCTQLCIASPISYGGYVCDCGTGYRKFRNKDGVTECW